MVDFAVLPPEVNSARMYAGSGSAPMLAAAAAWDRLAATLTSTVSSYRTVLEELTDGGWQGPSASAMFAAAQPYLSWLGSTAGQAAVTAGRARTVAALYEAAYAATVPPAVVAANRAQLANLTQSNVLGQNTAAIAANQADYAQMWATDATAMQTYAAGSAAAAPDLSALTAAPQTTTATAGSQAAAAQNAAGQAASQSTTGAIQALVTDVANNNPVSSVLNSPFVSGAEQLWGNLNGITMGTIGGPGVLEGAMSLGDQDIALFGAISNTQVFAAIDAGTPELASATSRGAQQQFTLAGSYAAGGGTGVGAGPMAAAGALRPAAAEVAATWGRAASLGELSVPASWSGGAQGISLAAAGVSTVGLTGLPAAGPDGPHPAGSGAKGNWLSDLPPMVGVVNAPRNAKSGGSRLRGRAGAPVAGRKGGVDDDAAYRSVLIAGVENASSGRDELQRLRHAVTEMARQREALENAAASMIEEGRVRNS